MQAILFSSEEVAKRANRLYKGKICQAVETEETIGRMVVIDIETDDILPMPGLSSLALQYLPSAKSGYDEPFGHYLSASR